MTVFEVYANNHIDPPLAHLAVAALELGFLSLLVFCVQQRRLALREASAARSAHDERAPLAVGAHFVRGTVEYARDQQRAVRVTIWQSGTETRGRNGANHRWTEFDRQLDTAPFYVRHASGARIRVDPTNAEVLLVDKLDQRHWTEHYTRGHRAELTSGETVIAEGVLTQGHDPERSADPTSAGRGYRDTTAGWVLAPRERKLHFSTEDLARRHALRARAFSRQIVVVLLLGVLGQLPLAMYLARVVYGVDTQAEFVSRTFWETRDSKGRRTSHWGVRYRYTDGSSATRVETDEIDHDDDARLRAAVSDVTPIGSTLVTLPQLVATEPDRLWLRRVDAYPSATLIGRGSSVHAGAWFTAGATLALAVYLALRAHRYRRWYEGKLSSSGSGTLGTPSGEVFDDERVLPQK